MALPVTRATRDKCTGHDGCPPRLALEGSPDVFTNSLPTVRLTDLWDIHCLHYGRSSSGSGTVFKNSLPTVRVTDAIDCGSFSAEGSGNVHAGG